MAMPGVKGGNIIDCIWSRTVLAITDLVLVTWKTRIRGNFIKMVHNSWQWPLLAHITIQYYFNVILTRFNVGYGNSVFINCIRAKHNGAVASLVQLTEGEVIDIYNSAIVVAKIYISLSFAERGFDPQSRWVFELPTDDCFGYGRLTLWNLYYFTAYQMFYCHAANYKLIN